MLANTVETVKHARALGATIVYAPITFTDDYHELSPNRTASSRASSTASRFARAPGARRSSTFSSRSRRHRRRRQARPRRIRQHESRLHPAQPRHHEHRAGRIPDQLLRRVDDAHGYEKGYEVVTLNDCTATLSEDEQRLAVEKNYPMFSRPMTHEEFLSTLGGAEAVGRSRAATSSA